MLLAESGFRKSLRLFGATLRTSDGKQFRATVSNRGSIDLNGLLGKDPRGSDSIELLKDGAPKFKSQSVVTDIKTQQKYTILEQLFDGPDYTLRFAVEKQV